MGSLFRGSEVFGETNCGAISRAEGRMKLPTGWVWTEDNVLQYAPEGVTLTVLEYSVQMVVEQETNTPPYQKVTTSYLPFEVLVALLGAKV